MDSTLGPCGSNAWASNHAPLISAACRIQTGENVMSKSTVTKLFVGAIVAFVAGTLVTLVAVAAAVASGAVHVDGSGVVGVDATPFVWGMIAVAIVGCLAMLGGAIAGLVSWIGALLNTAQLEDKTWFALILVLGIFNFGFIAMLVYVIAGPDGTAM